jgi:hypothetical protein
MESEFADILRQAALQEKEEEDIRARQSGLYSGGSFSWVQALHLPITLRERSI